MSVKRFIPWMVGLVSVFASASLFGLSTWLASTQRDHAPGGLHRRVRFARQADLLQRLELIIYDLRVKRAVENGEELDPSLGLVLFDDATILDLRLGLTLDERIHPLYPRSIYARVLRELRAQGARAVAFDILMPDEFFDRKIVLKDREGHDRPVTEEERLGGDVIFAREIEAAGNVILGAATNVAPFYKFRLAGAELGAVDSPKDPDGSERRVRAFANAEFVSAALQNYLHRQVPAEEIVNIDRSRRIITVADLGEVRSDLHEIPYGGDETIVVRTAKAKIGLPVFDRPRIWHMGIVLAAKRLGLDLAAAEIYPNRVVLSGTNGVKRIIPVDSQGYFPVDWTAAILRDERLKASIAAGHSKGPASYLGFPGGIVGLHEILKQDRERIESTNPEAPHSTFWNDKLVVVGSMANGNNMGDTGATPLAPTDALVSTYPNVANSILHNRFVHRMPFGAELSLVALWTALAAFATWKLRPVYSVSALVVANLILAAFGLHVFVGSRLWLPLAHPITGAIFLGFSPMITYRVLFSQREQQRVTAFFAKLVSPNVVQELLKLDRLALGGARREMTVFFADVRGFTEMTDRFQADAEEHVRLHGLEGAAAEAHFETKAGEVLETVNQYLAAIADVIKSNGGTLDKYIGDCVMAFWGAPTLNPRHAVDSVVAAIEAQRSIARLNDRRAGENAQIENENKARTARGDRPIPLLPLLALGSGLNTGVVTVGTMGSDQHGLNYTVFGREVNLASRLEGVSGRSRIVIGEATFTALRSLAPDLAKICVPLEPVSVKGFRQPIQAYEVLWRDAGDGTIRTRQVDSR